MLTLLTQVLILQVCRGRTYSAVSCQLDVYFCPGDDGETGAPGMRGPPGDIGPMGTSGPPGEPGVSIPGENIVLLINVLKFFVKYKIFPSRTNWHWGTDGCFRVKRGQGSSRTVDDRWADTWWTWKTWEARTQRIQRKSRDSRYHCNLRLLREGLFPHTWFW